LQRFERFACAGKHGGGRAPRTTWWSRRTSEHLCVRPRERPAARTLVPLPHAPSATYMRMTFLASVRSALLMIAIILLLLLNASAHACAGRIFFWELEYVCVQKKLQMYGAPEHRHGAARTAGHMAASQIRSLPPRTQRRETGCGKIRRDQAKRKRCCWRAAGHRQMRGFSRAWLGGCGLGRSVAWGHLPACPPWSRAPGPV